MHSVTSNAVAKTLDYLIWENPDSTVNVGAASYNFDRPIPAGYTKILIEYRTLSSETFFWSQEVEKDNNTYLYTSFIASSGNLLNASRILRFTSTGFDIEMCRYVNSSSGYSDATNRCIPHKIWARK